MPKKPRHGTIDADEAIRRYYEDGPASETEAFRDETEPVTPADERIGHPVADREAVRLSGGDVDASEQDIDVGAEAPGGSNPTPDQDIVDEIGKAVGVTYQDNEPLKFGDKVGERDEDRWELNPASAEDYQERREEAADAIKAASQRPKTSSTTNKPASSQRRRSKRPKS
ncbi:DUF6335 family protein [Nitrospira sp. Nam80]